MEKERILKEQVVQSKNGQRSNTKRYTCNADEIQGMKSKVAVLEKQRKEINAHNSRVRLMAKRGNFKPLQPVFVRDEPRHDELWPKHVLKSITSRIYQICNRIKELETILSMSDIEANMEGVKVWLDRDERRVCVEFDKTPCREHRIMLKRARFMLNRRCNVYYRRLTTAAHATTKELLEELETHSHD